MPIAFRSKRSVLVFITAAVILLLATSNLALAATPTLSSISPVNGSLGQTVSVTLTGTGFNAGAAFITVSGTGVGVTGVSVNSDTSLTATFLIATGATANNRTVSVSTTGGASGTVNFTVLGPPTLTSIAPSTGGAPSATVNLSGTNFPSTGMTISISGTGVTVSSITPSNNQNLRTATFAIAPDAPAGPRNVTVSTAAGTSSAVTFIVATQSQGYTISTVAGQGVIVEAGTATLQPLPTPNDVARDSSGTLSNGNLYITVPGANKVYKVTPGGAISTFAGNGRLGSSGDGGPATSAELTFPVAVAVDAGGNVYIAEGNDIRKVAGDGTISTYAGRPAAGFGGDGGPAIFAQFSNPAGLGIDSAGNLYVVDQGNNRIRKITAVGVISTVAGNGFFGYTGDNGPATAASLGLDGQTTKLAIDAAGNLYIPDSDNRVIRMVAANGTISTIAGGGNSQADNVPATAATLSFPTAVALDSSDPNHLKLFIVENGFGLIRVITGSSTAIAGGTIATAAGNGGFLFNGDGPAASVQLSNPVSAALDPSGNLYFTDSLSNRVRLLSGGAITTIAGNTGVCSGVSFCGADNVQATAGQLYLEQGVATDPSGNLFIADSGNGRIRKVASSNNTITTIAGNGSITVTTSSGTSATSTAIGIPWAVASTTSGIVYAAASNTLFGGTDSRIWKILPDNSISTVAGGSTSDYNGDNIPATSAHLNGPLGIVVNPANGNIYIADTCNFRVRMINVATGTISTIAGNGTRGYSGDGGQAVLAQLASPRQLALDSAGNLYIADTGSNDSRCNGNVDGLSERIWKVATNGTISTFSTFGGRGVAAANIGGSDNVFVANSTNIGRFYSDGSSITIAGGGFSATGSGYSGFSGDGGAALPALISVESLAVNGTTGDLFMADQLDNVVRKLAPVANGSTVIHAFPFGIQVRGGGNATATASIAIALPGGPFSWSATASVTTPTQWLSVSPSSGTASQFSFGALTATFTVAGLPAGSYNGSITITCTDATAVNGPLTIPVTLTILPLDIGANPGSLIVNSSTNNPQGFYPAGAQNPASQIINVFNPGIGGTINFTVAASVSTPTGGNWLSVSPLSGSASGTSTPLTTSYNIAGLSAGTYTGAITISSVGAVNSPVTVPVTLNLAPLTSPAPGLNSSNPVNGGQGQTVNVTLNGSNFLAVTPTVTVSGAGVTVTAATAVTTGTINAIFTIDPAAATGPRNVTVTTGGGTSNSLLFSVLGPPTLSSISPAFGNLGSTVTATFTGTNFVNGATAVTVAGTGVTATVLDSTSTTSRTVLLAIAPNTATGPRGVTVSTAAGTSGSVTFTVSSEAGYTISTVAGTSLPGENMTATGQPLPFIADVARDSHGNLYLVSPNANKVFKISSGNISTFAGTGVQGSFGDGGQAVAAQLFSPRAVAVDSHDNVLIADTTNNKIRKVATDGTITTFAGTGNAAFTSDSPAQFAQLNAPSGLGIDSHDNVYFTDVNNRRIRKVDTNGLITTVAGNGTSGFYGDGGPAVLAQVNLDSQAPTLAIDSAGNIYFPDTFNNRIRKVDTNGIITTIAGTGVPGFSDGTALLAGLNTPRGVSLDPISGGLFIADTNNNRIRKLTNGSLSTVAGNSGNGFNGDGSPATSFQLTNPMGLYTDSSGSLYITDAGSNRLRQLSTLNAITTIAGNTGGTFAGDGGFANTAPLYAPNAVALDLNGNLLIADTREYRIRKVDSTGHITTIAGDGTGGTGPENVAALGSPVGFVNDMVVDSAGNIYIATNNRIRKINASDGKINTIAGTGNASFGGDGGLATLALLNNPQGIAIDSANNVYIADNNNQRVRKINASDSKINTVAGTGFAGFFDNVAAGSAQFNNPRKLAFDAGGNLYVADSNNQRIRRIAPDGTQTISLSSVVTTFSTIGGSAVTFSGGSLYFASFSQIQRMFPDGTISAIAGPSFGLSGDNGPALMAAINVNALAATAGGTVYFVDSADNVVRQLTQVPSGFAALSVSPAGLNLRLANYNTASSTLTITLAGNSAFTWSATTSINGPSGGEWLTVSQPSGTGGFPLNVTANGSGLPVGIYTGSVTITSPQAVNGSVTVPVTMNVLPALITPPGTGFFPTAVAGGANPAAVNFTINNFGSGPSFGFSVASSVTTPPAGTWLSFTGGPATPGPVSVTYNIAGLAAGIYTGSVTVTAPSAANSPVVSPVTLTISPNGAPTLTSITPSSGSPGQTVFATLTGTNFFPSGTSITVPGGSGLSVSNVVFVNATTVYAIISISNNAALGPNNVTVTTPNGTTGAVTFTVSMLKKRPSQVTSQ